MVGVSDFERAMAFYRPVLQVLCVELRFVDSDRPWAGCGLPPR
jgi:lactoylglutathione lyase